MAKGEFLKQTTDTDPAYIKAREEAIAADMRDKRLNEQHAKYEAEYLKGTQPALAQAQQQAQQQTLSNVGTSGMISAGQASQVAGQQAQFAADRASLVLGAKQAARNEVRMQEAMALQQQQLEFAKTQWEAQNARQQQAHLLNMRIAEDQMETTPWEFVAGLVGAGLGAAATGFGGVGGQVAAQALFNPQGKHNTYNPQSASAFDQTAYEIGYGNP